jgi:hypothetical protein
MATPCEFKIGDRVGWLRPDGSVDPEFTGIIEEAEFKGSHAGGSYDCHYVVRLPTGLYFNAREGQLAAAPIA